ncbi:MAG TPA: LysM domain-containing protein, partial [Gammaproteobacteria bacterium]
MGRRRSAYVIVFWMAMLLAGCGELTPPGERVERYGTYTVRPGDTLYSIAWRYGLDHHDVAAWNQIRPPYVIHQGQVLVMSPPLRSWSEPPVSRPPTTC